MSLDKSDLLPEFTSAEDFYVIVSSWLNRSKNLMLPPSDGLYLADIKGFFVGVRRGPFEIYYHEKIGDYKLGAYSHVFFENIPELTFAEEEDVKNGPMKKFIFL